MTGRQVLGAVLAVLGLSLTLLGVLVLTDEDEQATPRPSAAELAAYEQAILPTVKDWGSIQVLGMRPAVTDLRSGTGVPAEAVVVEARAWRSALRADRDELRAVTPPSGLEQAAALFDESIAAYIRAAKVFARAARSTGDRRIDLLDDGIAIVTAADQVYNRASRIIQDARRRLGMEPHPEFPDKA